MANPTIIAIHRGTKRSKPDLVFAIIPERYIGPPTTGMDLALAILAAQPASYGGGHSRLETFKSMTLSPTFLSTGTLPAGSWMAFDGATYFGKASIHILIEQDKKAVEVLSTKPKTSWADWEDFRLPYTFTKTPYPAENARLWEDPWWDNTTLGLLMGYFDAALPLKFDTRARIATLNDTAVQLLTAASARCLKPWIGNPDIPRRGHGARKFAITSSKADTQYELFESFLGIEVPTGNRGFLNYLPGLRVLVPNALYAPTHWVKGPAFDKALGKFPDELLNAGRKMVDVLPASLPVLLTSEITDPELLLGSAHEIVEKLYAITCMDAPLKIAAPTFTRKR